MTGLPGFDQAEIPLVPGELYGMRSFAVTERGHLTPLHRATDTHFTQGIHEASCNLEGEFVLTFGHNTYACRVPPSGFDAHPGVKSPSKKCSCGFYAYFDQTRDTAFMSYVGDSRVHGIVRATGKCIVGDLGFRAEKIQIVGLVAGHDAVGRRAAVHARMIRVAHRLVTVPVKYVYVAIALNFLLAAANFAVDEFWVKALSWSGTSTIIAFALLQMLACFFVLRDMNKSDVLPKKPSRDVANKIRRQYPDIEFFDTLEAAREKFPLSKASELPT